MVASYRTFKIEKDAFTRIEVSVGGTDISYEIKSSSTQISMYLINPVVSIHKPTNISNSLWVFCK